MTSVTRPILAATMLASLSACGLHPLYGGGSQGAVATTLRDIQVAPIKGQDGWLVANALRDRLSRGGDESARYRLDVVLDDQITGRGVRADDAVTRERRTLRARYQLVDMTTGTVVLDDTAGSDTGIDVVGSEYATIAAEQSAVERLAGIVADQIVDRLAVYARSGGTPAAP